MGINIFADRKAQARFVEVYSFLPQQLAAKFSTKVKDLFEVKTQSEEGEYTEFKITLADINGILNSMK